MVQQENKGTEKRRTRYINTMWFRRQALASVQANNEPQREAVVVQTAKTS
jgi:hypothetical protein